MNLFAGGSHPNGVNPKADVIDFGIASLQRASEDFSGTAKVNGAMAPVIFVIDLSFLLTFAHVA